MLEMNGLQFLAASMPNFGMLRWQSGNVNGW
jgi:hypothetical protein